MTARQLEEIQSQARREGYQQGQQEGRDAGLGEYRQRIQLLDGLIRQLDKPFAELDDVVEHQLAELAMIVARQLVRRELKADPGSVVGVVREALAALPLAARDVQLALHPDDAVLVREAFSLQETEHSIRFVEDPVQMRGGCRVITQTSQIDATVASQLNAVIARVLGGERSSDELDEK